MKIFYCSFLLSLNLFASDISLDYLNEAMSGGDTTIILNGESIRAYQNPAVNLSSSHSDLHGKGDTFFSRSFSTQDSMDLKGLGPVFNNTSCIGCHTRDGRGALPMSNSNNDWVQLKQNEAIFLRISIEDGKNINPSANNNWGAPTPVPNYSNQLFHLGNFDVRKDAPGVGQAKVWMKFEFNTFKYPDGSEVILRKPIFKITDAYDDRIYQSDVRLSPRMGTPMIGLGLLEAIDEQDIIALSKRDLSDEGVHGHPNYVFDIEKFMANDPYPVSLGRFGLKASTPSVFHQSLGALQGDIGVTSYAFPKESIEGTTLYNNLNLPTKSDVEASKEIADAIVFYSRTLAVPSRRNVSDPDVVKGGKTFNRIGCTSCHNPSFVTKENASIPEFSKQKIYPFTDLLLHDMGDGLADNRRDFQASGREWRTRPLWGLGHTQVVNLRAGFLHDGRARTIEEAILWHDGEAKYAKDNFTNLSKENRVNIIKFLKSL